MARMGIAIVEASAERVVGRMPVAGNTQPYGFPHGGASRVLAESPRSAGAFLHAGPGRRAYGIEISTTHHHPATGGHVTGVATRLHGGRTPAAYEIVITDADGRRVRTSRLTRMLRDQGKQYVPRGGDGRSVTGFGTPVLLRPTRLPHYGGCSSRGD